MKIRCISSGSYQEQPITGRLALWQPQQVCDIEASDAAKLVATGLFTYEDSSTYVNQLIDHAAEHAAMGGASLQPIKTIALLGDSLTLNNNYDGSAFTSLFNSSIGYFSFASIVAGKRFATSPALNFGVFGDKTADVIARLNAVIVAKPNICIVLVGTNDISNDVSATTIISNLSTIWTALTAAGIKVICSTLWPRSDAGMNATRAKTLMQVNQLIRDIAPSLSGVTVWDPFIKLADPNSTTAGCVAALFADNLHVNRSGAYYAGSDLGALLNLLYPMPGIPPYRNVSGSDVYDATYFKSGNKFAHSMLDGVGGTNAGAYAVGNVASGWTVYRQSGSTITCVSSKGTVSLPNGQTYATQILTVSSPGGGAATESISFFQDVSTAAGDSVIVGSEIDIASVSGRLNWVTPKAQAQYGSYTTLCQDNYYASGGAASIPGALTGHTCTVVGVCPAGGTTVRGSIEIGLDCTVASSVVVTVTNPYFRKVS